MKLTLVALVAVFGAACANDSYAPKPRYAPRPTYGGGYGDDYKADANYKFAWEAVATGAGGGYGGYDGGAYGKGGGYGQSQQRFGQEENRYGDQTQGKYWVELPDGRLQTVDYSVDGYSGFVAQVSYSGGDGKGYGAPAPAPAPAYAPRPRY